jgi:hypothetical protein
MLCVGRDTRPHSVFQYVLESVEIGEYRQELPA